ncbi:dihydrofolate reductase family protein [Pseudonocardia sp.]|jgi:dihydrofolate reductase|uniref:dihydrofolate reductase family protein n=1 Tax=Pseudonocardia sp. TaxID=60912 RepID=UPI0031FD089B
MRKLKLEMQVSLDGFAIDAANEGGWTVWQWDDEWPWDQELRDHHTELLRNSDTILLSRQMVEDGFIDHWDEMAGRPDNPQHAFAKPISEMRKVIFSATIRHLDKPHCEFARGDLVDEVMARKNETGKDMMVYGGPTFVSSLMEAGLIDEVHLTVNPTALGRGVSPFQNLTHHVEMRPTLARRFDCGVVLLAYDIAH